MNLGCRAKKRVVLPSRPEPPTLEETQQDLSSAAPSDPLFSLLEPPGHASSSVDSVFLQCRSFLAVCGRLQAGRLRLQLQRAELRTAGDDLQAAVDGVKGQTLRGSADPAAPGP